MQQHIVTDYSPGNKEADLSSAGYSQSSPRVTQHKEAPAKADDRHEQNASFESELKEISSKMSLESEWITSSPVSSVRNNSQAKSHLKSFPSPGNDAGHIKTRSKSERSQRKKQTFKQRSKRQSSLETVKYARDSRHPSEDPGNMSAVPPPIEDAFMIPYTRTSSATFSAVPGTPSPQQGDNVGSRKDLNTVNRSKPALNKPQSVVITQGYRTTASSLSQKTLGRQPVRRDNMVEKTSESPRGRQRMAKQDPKKGDLSRTAEIRKDKHDKANTQENPDVYPVQVSLTFSLVLK